MAKTPARTKATLGATIEELRERAGLTRHALAKRARIDPAVLVRIETESREGVQFATVCRLAAALGVSLDDLAANAGIVKRPKTQIQPGPSVRLSKVRAAVERALRELDALD